LGGDNVSFSCFNTRAILTATTAVVALGSTANADKMPEERSLSGLEYTLIGKSDIYDYGTLDAYSEAPYLAELVAEGKLPAVADRLPAQPIIMKTGAMSDGIGEYGGVFRHVIGGRPEGWNWMAGQHQGWGGINMAMQECLVRQGPRWQVRAEEQTGPLPNLAQSWEWSEDRTEVTMNLMQGVKWSDGDAFDVEDVRFWWENNVEDESVSSRMSAGSFGDGATFEVIDDYTFKFVFNSPQSETVLEGLAYIQGCPGPSHILKDSHPAFNADATYEGYTNALPNDMTPAVVLGAWVPVVHRPDELVIMRRNPYYFKVDESGQQLPYFNEMHFRLSTWGDRTAQAVAGTGDFSNMEDPGNYVEALKQSQNEASPVTANFGPRVLSWRLMLNFNAAAAEDAYEKSLRTLFRETDFRVALSHALDRDAIGQSLARGPFAYPYIAGFASGSPYYDAESSVFQAFDQDRANALLDGLGLMDSDGDGLRNLADGGENIIIDVLVEGDRNADTKQLEAVASQLEEVGIRLQTRSADQTTIDTSRSGGSYTAMLSRLPVILPTRETCESFPVGVNCPNFNSGGDRLDFEVELAAAYDSFVASNDAAERAELAKTMQTLMTENVYYVGTVQIPAALLVNKRVRNAHPGTPVFMYEWAEDSVMRERLWTPADLQVDEVLPKTIAEY
jgi:peptide/nickel transport system substrate-binding protein